MICRICGKSKCVHVSLPVQKKVSAWLWTYDGPDHPILGGTKKMLEHLWTHVESVTIHRIVAELEAEAAALVGKQGATYYQEAANFLREKYGPKGGKSDGDS